MNADERREKIVYILENAKKPTKGSELAKGLSVSRQVIVQDIALIRARGYEIIATPQGYILYSKSSIVEYIECNNHINDEEIYEEFKTIVDMGGVIKNVIVKHPAYGDIKVDLNISTQKDILNFMAKIKNNEFKQLSLLSEQVHVHEVEATSREMMQSIISELEIKGILSK